MGLRRFYIAAEQIGQPAPEITGPEAGHIVRVLRMGVGDRVELFDGSGSGYRARIVAAAAGRVAFAIEERFPLSTESSVSITLAQGFLKERKLDELVRPLTELGIDGWMPFFAARSVPQPDRGKLDRRRARWEKIALEAVKQCRRGRIPRIAPVDDLAAVLADDDGFDLKVIFWEAAPTAFRLPAAACRRPRRILLAVGPEGGFTDAEVAAARAAGFITTGLGPRILRAETAALAAVTLTQYRFGDMGGDADADAPVA